MQTKNHTHFEKLVETTAEAELGNLFGKPCGKIKKKAFVSFFEDEMVFKIGRDEVGNLLKKYEGSKNWDPSGKGRPMKDWIQVPETHKKSWKKLTLKAVEFLNESK